MDKGNPIIVAIIGANALLGAAWITAHYKSNKESSGPETGAKQGISFDPGKIAAWTICVLLYVMGIFCLFGAFFQGGDANAAFNIFGGGVVFLMLGGMLQNQIQKQR